MQRYSIQKSFQANNAEVARDWYHIDASEETLGRMAARIARILMGKNKPTYTPNVDCGDFVVVTNASKVKVTGKKLSDKLYYHHTGYLGGLKTHTLAWMLEHKPDQVVRLAVRRMLPKSRLGRKMLTKLKAYGGAEHSNTAQQPTTIKLS